MIQELIKKYLEEWMEKQCSVRVEFNYWRTEEQIEITYSYGSQDESRSLVVRCDDLEKGLSVLRERLQKI